MKLKEVDRTAMQAWSPSQHHPIYLATGTSAQQLDATFSTNASLEIFELDLTDPALDLKSCATFSSPHSPSGRATVWDLRKNEPIIKVSDHSNRMHCSGLEWHPEVATQMVLASEDDRLPVIQIWDLRFASSPLRVLENHARGILTIAWSMADPELLLSCGKDSKILCSNPNTGEVLYELPTSTQWCFDVQWCPRNPALLSAASFDGKISVYSIMGGSTDSLRQKQADKLSSSFGNLDPFGTGHPLPPLHLPQQTTPQSTVLPLKKPPKWIRRPVGASFSFGGRLVTFENNKTQQQGEHPQQLYHVYVSQVVTEKEFLNRSNQLQEAVQAEAFSSYCQKKIDVAKNDFERNVWSFLKVHFEEDSRGKYLELLGYKKDGLGQKVNVSKNTEFDSLQPINETFNISVTGDIDGLITQALLTGNFESAVDLCLHDNRMADAIILAIAGGQELLSKTQKKYFAKTRGKITRLITAVVTKNWKEIVQSCDLQNWKEALAAVLTYARLDEFAVLCDLLGSRLENEGDSVLQTQACLCFICAGNVEKLVSCWTKAQDGNNPLSLQDLIEKVVILRKAVQQTQVMDANAVGVLLTVAKRITPFTSFLPTRCSPNIVVLRDRICKAQGELSGGSEAPPAPYERQPAAKGRSGPAAGQMPQNPTPQYYQQVRIAPTVTTWSNKNPTALPSFPAASPSETQRENPPPPPGFIMQKDMNPHMPPHQPAHPDYNMYTRQPCPQPCQPPQPYSFRPSHYQPQQPPLAPPTSTAYPTSNPPYMPSNPAGAMPPPLYSSQPQASPTSLNPSPSLPPPPASFQHGRPGAPPSSLPSYALPPGPTGTETATSELAASQRTEYHYLQDQASFLQGPQNGWNDPPALSRAGKKKKVPDTFLPPVPITAPIMTPLSDPQAQLQQPPTSAPPLTQVPFQPSHLPPGQPGLQNPFQNVAAPGVQTIMTPAVSASSMEGAPGAPIGNTVQHMQSLPTEKITKKPIPEEHLILKSTFEALIQRCLSSATDPVRLSQDTPALLFFFFLKCILHLHNHTSLSPMIINGLHNIARSIETRNYTEGLNIHTHIVSTSNFSEISAFMPVLKVVLTQANKLGV
uniref:Protein transport protein Sec31A n=1 Tax=Pseudonaja textilis TaxID=8673 RepID=A0A670ZSX4_PSETE